MFSLRPRSWISGPNDFNSFFLIFWCLGTYPNSLFTTLAFPFSAWFGQWSTQKKIQFHGWRDSTVVFCLPCSHFIITSEPPSTTRSDPRALSQKCTLNTTRCCLSKISIPNTRKSKYWCMVCKKSRSVYSCFSKKQFPELHLNWSIGRLISHATLVLFHHLLAFVWLILYLFFSVFTSVILTSKARVVE